MSQQESTETIDTSAAFAAGFEDDQPAAIERPASTEARDESPADASAADTNAATTTPAAEEDEFAGLSPKARALLQEVERLRTAAAAVPQLEHRLRQAEGRLGDLNGRIPKPPPPAPPKLERFERLREELPEVADGLEEYLQHHMPKKADPEPTPQASSDDIPTPVLDAEFPDWGQTISSNEFKSWLASQPAEYQTKVQSTDSEAVFIGALAKFKTASEAARVAAAEAAARAAAAGQVNQVRNARATRAAVPATGARRAPSTSDPIADAFASGFNEG